jgi:nitroreductase
MLQATELGLGTVWVGAFHEEEVSRIMNLPPYLRPVAIVPVGFPKESPPPPPRVPVNQAIEDVNE